MSGIKPPYDDRLLTKSMVTDYVGGTHVIETPLSHEQASYVEGDIITETLDEVMLTTIDNPNNPFTHYDEWLEFDESSGYYSNSLLGRIAVSSEDMSEADQELEYIRAIDEIVTENVSGVHRKVYKHG